MTKYFNNKSSVVQYYVQAEKSEENYLGALGVFLLRNIFKKIAMELIALNPLY